MVPALTFAQAKLPDALLQPAGSVPRSEVTDKLLARLPSSVVKVTVTAVVLPVSTAMGLRFGVPTMLSLVVARYAIFSEPVFAWPALLSYE